MNSESIRALNKYTKMSNDDKMLICNHKLEPGITAINIKNNCAVCTRCGYTVYGDDLLYDNVMKEVKEAKEHMYKLVQKLKFIHAAYVSSSNSDTIEEACENITTDMVSFVTDIFGYFENALDSEYSAIYYNETNQGCQDLRNLINTFRKKNKEEDI